MLFLAIILTIVSAICFGVSIGLTCYVIATKIREARQRPGPGAIMLGAFIFGWLAGQVR